MYGHSLGAAVGLGYVSNVSGPGGAVAEAVDLDRYEIEVAGVRHRAVASLRPMYDPKNERIRGA
jgi:4-methylaminobutanoate oxidase (formaldehyde-forming)